MFRQPAAALEQVIGAKRYARLLAVAGRFRETLGQRTIWNVSSTAVGGGVAEMLRVLVGYAAGLDIPVRWAVIGGDPEFFAITKRLHNQIHGQVGDAGPGACSCATRPIWPRSGQRWFGCSATPTTPSVWAGRARRALASTTSGTAT